jgi:hypothetical protein
MMKIWMSGGLRRSFNIAAMINSIAVLELLDFEGIGHKIPEGTGVDAMVNNCARAKDTKQRSVRQQRLRWKIQAVL